MPQIIYAAFDRIEGECNVRGHEGQLEVREYTHSVWKAVDPLDTSRIRSNRHHESATILVPVDKASPLLWECLITNRTISWAAVNWYRQPPEGQSDEEHYFAMAFEDCIVTSFEYRLANIDNPENTRVGHLAEISFGYRALTAHHVVSGKEFCDDVRRGRFSALG